MLGQVFKCKICWQLWICCLFQSFLTFLLSFCREPRKKPPPKCTTAKQKAQGKGTGKEADSDEGEKGRERKLKSCIEPQGWRATQKESRMLGRQTKTGEHSLSQTLKLRATPEYYLL